MGDEIPITARILQVVDVYDALTSMRPYKAAMSGAAAIGIMREEVGRGWWDPRVLEALEHLLENEFREPAIAHYTSHLIH